MTNLATEKIWSEAAKVFPTSSEQSQSGLRRGDSVIVSGISTLSALSNGNPPRLIHIFLIIPRFDTISPTSFSGLPPERCYGYTLSAANQNAQCPPLLKTVFIMSMHRRTTRSCRRVTDATPRLTGHKLACTAIYYRSVRSARGRRRRRRYG